MTANHDWICLSLLPGLGPVGISKLIGHFGGIADVLQADFRKLAEVEGMRSGQLLGFKSLDTYKRLAEEQVARMHDAGGRILSWDDPEYPGMLRQIPDPPPVLYTLGDMRLLGSSSVAMVGARSATGYGRRVAYSLAKALAENSVTVLSGLAAGIDSESHSGALKGGGGTIAVLGCGVDVVYPRQNRSLYEQIRADGLLVSEYPLGTQPEGFRFPARNRIIAGLCLGVVVVEAAKKSGSLITAQLALDFGREIFAVPGQVDSFKSEGTHWLLRQGAQLVVSADDILQELKLVSVCHAVKNESAPANKFSALDPDAVVLLNQLEPYPLLREEVSDKSGFTPARLSELFLFLELEGHIEMLPGDMVRRIST